MDVHSPHQRSFNMSRIQGKDTKPEMMLREWLWSKGYRYRLHRKDIPGTPDIVFLGRKKVIFAHGCFWHKHDCKYFKWPKTNSEFWKEKIEGNVSRDDKNYQLLTQNNWQYLVVWECETKSKAPEKLFDKIEKFLLS
ncbi:very short patch repair endonuclease [Thermodesulfobacteriota bacterium]